MENSKQTEVYSAAELKKILSAEAMQSLDKAEVQVFPSHPSVPDEGAYDYIIRLADYGVDADRLNEILEIIANID